MSEAFHAELAGHLVSQPITDMARDPRDRAECPEEEVHDDLRHEHQHEDNQPKAAGPDADARPRALVEQDLELAPQVQAPLNTTLPGAPGRGC